MKNFLKNHSTALYQCLPLALALGLALPLPALAASVALATSPLAVSTTNIVKPNVTFLLDNSGSMSWEHMPDDSTDQGSSVTFSYGYYGLRSSQCNQVYYNPAITYLAPINADETPKADASFSTALPSGYLAAGATIVSAAGDKNYTNTAVNLNSGFKAHLPASYSTVAGDTFAQGAYYYSYSGAQTTSTAKDYNSITNAFYKECHDSTGGSAGAIAPVNGVKALLGGTPAPVGSGVFTKVRLSPYQTTTLTVSGTGGANTSASVSGITVNGVQIMNAASATANNISSSTMATNIAAQINAKTATSGFSATVAGSTITITSSATAASYASSVANFTPVVTSITGNLGTIQVIPDVFPDTDAAHLTNFANWYSFYRTRMLMMKTAAGRAFSKLNKDYRVGLMKLSASSTPVVYLDTFWDNTNTALGPVSTQRTTWYNTLYNMAASSSTPLRQALSNAGRYYAGKLAGADPIQYSCQQNFTIMSTDGFWNGTAGFKENGTTAVGNQDGTTALRPMNDGAQSADTQVSTFRRISYTTTSTGCTSPQIKLVTQPQYGTCSRTKVSGVYGAESCTWVDGPGPATYGVGSTTYGSCASASSVTIPTPNPSNRVQIGSTVTTAGAVAGTSDMLADVAMYYYNTDLRPGTCTLCTDNVFISSTDKNTQQHMTTFTLGLGASGRMRYSQSYLTDSNGDYMAVRLGLTASTADSVCPWQNNDGKPCKWPTPGMNSSGDGFIENIDDMWHAAVNGRGAYYSATDPTTLADGLSNALAAINSKKGSAAAAATSTLNPVAGNNFAYVASYTTVKWQGNLEARGINTDTAAVSENATWCVENVVAGSCASPATVESKLSGDTTTYNCVTPNATLCTGGTLVGSNCEVPIATTCTGTMNSKVGASTDTRNIYTRPALTVPASPNPLGLPATLTGQNLVPFDADYATANPTNFAVAKISALSQWATLTAAQKTAAEGVNLIKYLRGQYGYEDRSANVDKLYRYREAVMGDALESQPAFISKPVFSYLYPGYSAYATAQANRAGTVYIGANDGMMHAFAADTGIERWAYVPSMVIPNMWKLADMDYSTMHTNFVNGSPITSDVCTANCTDPLTAVWRTILVGGLNGGGRGYYALDITNPVAPVLLWEFTPSNDADLGYSYGQPVITKKNDGTWVVLLTSGYDNGTLSANPLVSNSPTGDGKGYLYVLNAGTGTVLSKLGTGVGSTATPSGLAKIAAWSAEAGGNLAGPVYGGDLQGNIWRFDINSGAVLRFATLYSDAAGTLPQPITTTPILGDILGKRVVFIGTGKYLETTDLPNTQVQTQYAIKDDDATATFVNPRNTLVRQYLINNPDGSATRLSSGSSSTTAATANNTVNFYTGRGWYVDLPDSKERVNIDAKLVQGTLLVPSIVPSNTDCSPGGYGWLNYFNYKTGGALDASGLASEKMDATIVGVNVVYVHGEPKVLIVTSANPTPQPPDTPPPFLGAAAGFSGKRVIWRELIQ